MVPRTWYEWIAAVAAFALGVSFRTRQAGRTKLGSLFTLITIIIAAGVCFVRQREGSVEQSGLYWLLSLAAGELVGEIIFFIMRKIGKWTYVTWDNDTD